MVVVTWNVNSLRQRLAHLSRLVDDARPDVLCLQETKCVDEAFPAEELRDLGYVHQLVSGQKTYNGVAILSKLPIEDPRIGFTSGEPDPQCRLVAGTIGGVRVFDCYVPMGTSPTSDKFQYKLRWLARLRGELNAFRPDQDVLVCGDLNVALEERDVWDPFTCEGKILFHPMERAVLKKVMDWGLKDAYRELAPEGDAFTWWDYRAGAFWKNQGYRIDYLLASAPLMARLREVVVWRDARKWEKPSDHAPVAAHIA